MNRVVCPNGHFFDGDKFSSCPHCAEGVKAVTPSYFDTMSRGNVATEPVEQQKPEKKKWGLFNKNKSNNSSPIAPTNAVVDAGPTEYLINTGNGLSREIPAEPVAVDPVSVNSYSGAGDYVPPVNTDNRSVQPTPVDTTPEYVAPVTPTVPPVNSAPEQNSSLAAAFSAAQKPVAAPAYSSASRPSDEGKTVGYFSAGNYNEPPTGFLVCTKGEDFGMSFPLKTGNNTIGRSQTMDVVITDPKVSREKQAYVMYEPKKRQFYLKPGEGNGLCYYNDDLVMAPTIINAYDKITVGDTELMLIAVCNENFSWEDLEK